MGGIYSLSELRVLLMISHHLSVAHLVLLIHLMLTDTHLISLILMTYLPNFIVLEALLLIVLIQVYILIISLIQVHITTFENLLQNYLCLICFK